MEKILSSEYVTIGELARLTGCRYSTLKFYTEEGMLPFEQAEQNLTRRYKREESVERVAWICTQRKAGKTVPEITAMLCHAAKKENGNGQAGIAACPTEDRDGFF